MEPSGSLAISGWGPMAPPTSGGLGHRMNLILCLGISDKGDPLMSGVTCHSFYCGGDSRVNVVVAEQQKWR